MRRAVVILACGLVVAGCATRPHTYTPPDSSKVKESTQKVKEGIKRSRDSAAEAKKLVSEAQANADKINTLSVGLMAKIEDILKIAPAELKPPLEAIRTDASDTIEATNVLNTGLVQAWQKHDALEKHLSETDAHEAELERRQDAYYTEAKKLADKATEERNYRIAAEKQLSSQRWFGWLFKLGAFLLIGIVAIFFLLKWLGKLGWAAGKIGIKAAI